MHANVRPRASTQPSPPSTTRDLNPNLIDLLIVAAVVVGLVNGYRRGFWLSLAQYVGLVVGVVLGAAAAGPLLDYIGIHNPVARPFRALLVLVIGGTLASRVGLPPRGPVPRTIPRRGPRTIAVSSGGAPPLPDAVLARCSF